MPNRLFSIVISANTLTEDAINFSDEDFAQVADLSEAYLAALRPRYDPGAFREVAERANQLSEFERGALACLLYTSLQLMGLVKDRMRN